MPLATTNNVRSAFVDSLRRGQWIPKDGAEFELGINNKTYKMQIVSDIKGNKKIIVSRAASEKVSGWNLLSRCLRDFAGTSATAKLQKSLNTISVKNILLEYEPQERHYGRDGIATKIGNFWGLSDRDMNKRYSYQSIEYGREYE